MNPESKNHYTADNKTPINLTPLKKEEDKIINFEILGKYKRAESARIRTH